MPPSRILILFAGRFPGEKAAALFADMNAASLAAAGAEVTIFAPRRLGRAVAGTTSYRVRYIPVVDLSRIPIVWSIANYVLIALFSISVFFRLLFQRDHYDLIVSNDAIPLIAASYVTHNLMYEMHDFPEGSRYMYSLLFRRIRWILATNEWKAAEVQKHFNIPAEKIFVERNAVDVDVFGKTGKLESREALGLEKSLRLVVYTGHLYEWKGADTLADAAAQIPEATFIFVGGSPTEVDRFRLVHGSQQNIRIIGHVPHTEIPVWQSAADILVLPNSGKEEISVHYTSPMKLFEYMATERPIVASDLPSIREIGQDNITYAVADNAESFAKAIQDALNDVSGSSKRATLARQAVLEHTWNKRAGRILARIHGV